jgi:quercetin 2,3-dioxygenase
MKTIRKADERGFADHGWLKSRHTFSFGDYFDPAHVQFRGLRVLNDDRVAGGKGFATHGHRDMEIISYVLDGALEHRDSMNNGSIIRPGDVQRMSAGTGIQHSEFNASEDRIVHFLQIWILPAQSSISPGYEQKHFAQDERNGVLRLVASPQGTEGSLRIHADAKMFAGNFAAGQSARYQIAAQHQVWIHVARGTVHIGDSVLQEGDGMAVLDESNVHIEGVHNGEVLLFDLA